MKEITAGRYNLLERLGAGSMGEVFRAVDRLNNQTVALKRVARCEPSRLAPTQSGPTNADDATRTITSAGRSAASTSGTQLARFSALALASEFRVLSTLRHPNIVDVLDYGFDEQGRPYFTMSLVPSAATITVAAAGKPFEAKLHLIFQLLEALSYLHRHGVVHRDLKPSNVLVTGERVTVLDFGLTGLQKDLVMGTVGYMAPEIAIGGEPSPAADLYAVGIIAFEILSAARAARNRAGLPKRPDFLLLPVNERVRALIERLCATDPRSRPQEAKSVIGELAAAAGVPPPPERVEYRESYLKSARLVGRQQELALLGEALTRAISGSGGTWLIGGESGVGKSRLLSELRPSAMVQGAVVLTGHAEGGAPYSLFRDAAMRLALLAGVDEAEASALKMAFPEIERVAGRAVPDWSFDPQTYGALLTSTILAMLRRCPAPVLLELEDCHLAGESLAVLRELTAAAGAMRLLIIVSYRDNERPKLPQEIPGSKVLKMSRFDRLEIHDMVEAMLGPELGRNEALVSFLARETEGNAFFLVEAVRALAETSGELSRISPGALPEHLFASGIMDAVYRRLSALPSWAGLPLQAAAILGREVELAVLQAASPDTDIEKFLMVCADAAVLEGHGYRWRFTHDKFREALLARLEGEPRRDLHARVGAAIETLHGEDSEWIALQTQCWTEAGVPAKAVHYQLLGCDQMLKLGLPTRAIDYGLAAVRLLGEQIPDDRESQGQAIGQELQRIDGLLAGRAPAELLALPLLQDERIERIIQILTRLQPAAHVNGRAELFALAALRCMSLTLEHGLGPAASFVLGTYALVSRNLTGDYQRAFDYGRLAIDVDVRLRGTASPAALFVHYWFLNHWLHPLEMNLQPALEGARIGLAGEDILFGCFNAASYPMYMMAVGAPLAGVVEEADRQLERIGGRVRIARFHALQERQIAQALAGKTTGPLDFTDPAYDETVDLASITQTPNYSQIFYYYSSKMRMHYYYHQYEAALEWAAKAVPLTPAIEGQIGEWEFCFFRGLTLAAAPGANTINEAKAVLAQFDGWAQRCPANFAHRRDLIKAEVLRAERSAGAGTAFAKAVAAAEARGWIHDIALSNERAAEFFREAGDRNAASRYAAVALRAYRQWGAKAKATEVEARLIKSPA